MDGFIRFMEKHFVPIASRIGAQRHLVAIRDGFVSIMPLVLAGSFAVLLNNTLLQWIPGLGELSGINGNIWWGTFAIMTLLVVFSIGYNLAKGYQSDGLAAGLIAVGAFISVTPQAHGEAGWGYIHWGYLNATGLFTGILVALIATEIFVKLMKKNIVIKMPENVPPAVGRAFAAVIPGVIVLYVFGILGYLITKLGGNSLYDLIFNLIQKPLQGFSQGLASAMIAAMLINLFWFFGLHGANIMDPIMNALYLPALEANASAIQQGLAAPNVVTRVFFDAYIHLGGSGATLALILAIYIAAKKRREYREVAKLSTPAGIFQINEPVMFGLPIVLNPILFIPFILTPGILTLIAYTATAIGLVPPTYVAMPWITPVGIGGFLATGGSIAGGILALVNFAAAVLIYLPFVVLADRQVKDKEKQGNV
ncbi:PTS system cellobiose-specific IIC component [Anaerosolibacter carboniphilus]|uniref:Permease IIC component n=1 Tax=Anaerosolibacter carboniphilus TaxID=1417629 RepID=A0A841KQI6_9FIRM|nr:PTS sugar transporter subunit IIC [Anaerosolibacter carboniphilus]MBB6214378.1 PTS system cellobiose-specific IIC component [Anaerosolibacter carboniphilus]